MSSDMSADERLAAREATNRKPRTRDAVRLLIIFGIWDPVAPDDRQRLGTNDACFYSTIQYYSTKRLSRCSKQEYRKSGV